MIVMQIEVQVCDNGDPRANQIVDGVYRATPGALQALRAHKRVKIANSPPPMITLDKADVTLIEERIIPNA